MYHNAVNGRPKGGSRRKTFTPARQYRSVTRQVTAERVAEGLERVEERRKDEQGTLTIASITGGLFGVAWWMLSGDIIWAFIVLLVVGVITLRVGRAINR